MLENVPDELRQYRSWVLWRFEEKESGKKPTKVPYSVKGYPANVNTPSSWCDFDSAVSMLKQHPDHFAGVGFVLSENDPFAFIDLDDPYDEEKGYDEDSINKIVERHQLIHEAFDSYSELSPSGRGLHILCKGSVAQGRKRAQVEVYSTQRFMTVTGNVLKSAPISDKQDLLTELWSEMGKDVKVYDDIPDQPAKDTDDDVCRMAYEASNGAKFADLYMGNWNIYYNSQSEADFALIDIVAFYTKNRGQIVRIFRSSALGQRDKAWRNDYVDYMINRSFDHELPPIDIEGLKIQVEAAVMAHKAALEQEQTNKLTPKIDSSVETQVVSVKPQGPRSVGRNYTAPPGLLGELTRFIYEAATRPVFEIALAGAIGLMSGVTGRAYNISGTGLNQYTLLIAPTGTGKEAMRGGIDKIIAAVTHIVTNAQLFIGPGEIASPQALSKHFHRHSKSFVAMPGEIGLWLQEICSPTADPAKRGIMRLLLQLYNISGKGDVFKATINSQKDDSTDATKAPAFSLLGESTPEEFYKALDESMISSGLVPRFSIIEYRGKRPRKNAKAQYAIPSDGLVRGLAGICTNALALNEQNEVINVAYTQDGLALLEQWDKFCDDEINVSGVDSGNVRRHLWNRAHIKALKLAAIVAVGCHPYKPEIDYQIASWAIDMVNTDTLALLACFDAGEIGFEGSEARQMADIVECFKDYLVAPYSAIERYQVPQLLHAEKIISYAYIYKRLSQKASFKGERNGRPVDNIKRAIQTLMDRGEIREVPRNELSKLGTTARAFMISMPRAFGL